MKTSDLLAFVLSVPAWLVGCAEIEPNSDEIAVGTIAQGLSAVDQCFTTPRDKLLTGGGEFITNTSYTHGGTGCENGYLLDLDNYATKNNLGTTVMYAGAVPTDAATCNRAKIRAYVWERLSNGGTFLGKKMGVGDWVVDARGVGHCVLPALKLETVIPNYEANGSRDFRIAMRAELESADGTFYTRKEIAFATVELDYLTPGEEMRGPLSQLGGGLSAHLATHPGVVSSTVQAVWNIKNTYTGSVLCRSTQLEHTLLSFNKRSLIKAGARSTWVDARVNAVRDIHAAYCTPGGTALGLQDAVFSYLSNTSVVHSDIRERLFAHDPRSTETSNEAANLMGRLAYTDLGTLVRRCDLTPEAVTTFLTSGALPDGVSADRLLLGSCGSQDAATVAGNLGVGGNFRGQSATSARAAFLACMKPPDVGGNPRDVCNDPRAQGAGAPASNEPDGEEDAPMNVDACLQGDNKTPCTEEDKADIALDILREQQREAQRKAAEQRIARENAARNPARDRAVGTANGDKENGVLPALIEVAEAIIGIIPVVGDYKDWADLAYATAKLSKAMGEAYPTRYPKPSCIYGPPGHELICGAGMMCNPDFAPGGWYETSSPDLVFSSSGPPARQLDKSDRLSHCLCDMMVAEYGVNGDRFAISAACPTAEERERQNCIANPYGPQDEIKRECIKHLNPGGLDEDAWRAKICQAKRCPEAGQVPFVAGDGSCDCSTINVTTGRLPACRISELALCPAEESGPCFCQPLDNGLTPSGGDPFCGRDVSTPGFVGAKDSLTLVNPLDAFVHQLDTQRRVLMVRPGRTSVGLPTFYENTLPNLGTALRTEVVVGARPAAGHIDLQVFCTNLDRDLVNAPMGECRLTAMTPGVPSNCDIQLNPSVLTQCRTGTFNLEYVLNTAPEYKAYTAISSTRFAGTLTTTPPDAFIPACPRPSPITGTRLIEAVNPTWTHLGGDLATPSVLWTFSTDLRGEIPRHVPLIR